MRTNFVQTCKTSANRINLNRITMRVALIGLFISLGVGNAWAGGTTYKTDFKATADGTGKGYVYASTSSSPSSIAYAATSDDISESSDTGGSDKTTTYYAWAKAVRGNEFKNWSISGSNGGVSPTSSTDNHVTVTVTSNKENGTNTGTAKAYWTSYTKVNVTYNPSEDGVYSVTYQYNSYNSSSKTITAGDAENLGRNITSENGAQTIGSYHNDVITLQSVSGDFQGWYSDAGCKTLLSTANPYTYVAPQSGTGSVYAKYPHVDKYYGRLTASIAEVPYSMPGGGTIFVSKEEAGTGTYSADAQTVDNIGMGTTGLKYYLHAKPNDKRYVFRGWYSNPECTGTALSTSADYTYTFKATSKNSASPTTGNVYAAFDFNLFYMQVELEPAVPGLGMVLVKDNNTGTPDYTAYASHSEQFLYAYRGTPTANAYLYAKPKYGYKFSGWYDNPDCTGTAKSIANPYTYAATAGTSTDPMNPTIIKLYAKFVEDDSKVNITYNIPDKTKGEYTASVLDIAEVDDEFVWTFTEVYNSADYTANTTLSQNKTDVLRLEAQPKAGYGVTSWTIAGTAKTTPSHLYETTATAAATHGVTFGDAKPFLVSRNSTYYSDFQEAITAANGSGTITVVQDAYVPAGNYTLSGVALYVPRANGSAAKGTSVERSQAAVTTPTPYVTLTLANGANITTNSSIEVGAQIVGKAQDNSSASAGCNGAISGTYGRIVMNEGSTITLNGSAILYAWGQIVGSGRITANSGTTVYEIFQVTDWCGGSRAYACNDGKSTYKMFPFSQYHIQNIEVPLRIKNGASEKLMAVIDGNNANDIPLIGANNSTSMFRMNSSDAYIEKSYDKVNDRQIFRVNGTASISDFSLTVVISISTTSFHLPLTNNMIIYIESGTTTLNTNAIVNADARIIINEGATAELASGKSLFVYDADDWGAGFVFNGKKIAPIRYSLPYATTTGTSSGTPIRTSSNLQDASILVNGTLIVNGSLYTSSGNANIYSTATGVIKFGSAAASSSTTVYHLNTISGSSFLAKVATTYNTTMLPAKLRNEDGTFVATEGAVANDQFIYSKDLGKWMKNPKVITWNANGGEVEPGSTAHSQDAFLGELPVATREGYDLVGWFTTENGGTQISQTTKVTATTTYHAHWTPNVYNITYKDQGKAAFSGTHVDSPNAHPTKHTYGTATTLNGVNNKANALFDGWHTISNCKAESKVTSLGATAVTKDITLYAKWIPLFTLTVAATPEGYGAVSASSVANVPEGSAVTVSGNTFTVNGTTVTATPATQTAQYTYTFDHWNNLPATVTTNVTNVQAEFTRTARSYNLTWVTDGDALTGTYTKGTVAYGTSITQPNTPTKTGYTFAGWHNGSSVVTPSTMPAANTTYTATWTEKTYSVTFYNGGHGTVQVAGATIANGGTASVNHFTTKALTATASTGYTFAGWTTTGSVTLGSTSAASTTIKTTAAGGSVTAIWTPINYTISYNLDGGSVDPSNPTNYNIETATFTLTNPTKTGYTFAGWTGTGLAGATMTVTITKGSTGNRSYTATFESSGSGFYVDIVDVNNSAKKLKLNVSGWPASGWPYYVNGTAYIRDVDRLADRTMWIPYTGEPGEDFTIIVRQLTADGALISNRTYEIPKEVMSNSTLSAAESNPLYVKGTTMNVSLNMTASNIYVAPDAKLHVVSGKTLTVDTIFLRTTPTSAAELILDGDLNEDAQVVYTRIISSKSGYFQFGLPLDCDVKLEDIRLSNGTDPKYYTGSGWVLRAYDEESRANNGLGDNWVSLEKTDKIKGGIGYEMYSGMNYYREFYFPVDVKELSSDLAVTYTEGPNVADNGWNMLVSPMTSTYIKEPMPEDLVISWMEADGFSAQEVPSSILPAKVFAYQAAAAGSISFDMSSNAPVRNRMAAAAEQTRIQWMHLDIKDANGVGDQTSIYSHPTRYEASFQPGIDVAKQSLTASRAIIYSSHAYGEMAFAGVADEMLEQGVALTVYSPKAQELTISMRENDWLNRMAFVWLIDQATGAQIDLLDSDYSFNAEAGTTAGRFILMGVFFAPQITTDNGNVQSDDEGVKAKKFIYNDKMYIQINGVIYDATGKLVK